MPGSRVYTCLSHDIIAHETTHAILDGMHRRFNEPTNPDVLAFHEAFADIVALMQHFTIPELLESEIAPDARRHRGRVDAGQPGRPVRPGDAAGAARCAMHRQGRERRLEAERARSRRICRSASTPHSRGAILVAAVFDAFIAIYKTRTADLLRIYTGGTGVLPNGAIHPDLVQRLADEAAKRPVTCSTCASARSTTCRRSTSPSSSTCAR